MNSSHAYIEFLGHFLIFFVMDDKAAFDRMFNEWYAQFVYFAYYFVNDVEVCRDIVSDAFEYLWRNYDKIEEVTLKLDT